MLHIYYAGEVALGLTPSGIEYTLCLQLFLQFHCVSFRSGNVFISFHDDIREKLLEFFFRKRLSEEVTDIPAACNVLNGELHTLDTIAEPEESYIHAFGSLGVDDVVR